MDYMNLVLTQVEPGFKGPPDKWKSHYPKKRFTYTLLRTDEMS